MLPQDLIDSLPEDPESAFPVYERRVREICLSDKDPEDFSGGSETQYMMYMLAFINFHKLDIGLPHAIPPQSSAEFWDYFREAERKISYYGTLYTLSAAYDKRCQSFNKLVLTPALKREVHHYIDQIRDILNTAKLEDQKRDTLSRKLNAFAEEIDRDRTSLAALASAYIHVKREVKDNTEWALRCLEKFDRIWSRLTKATDALPEPGRTGEIEGPKKQIAPPTDAPPPGDLDDEIPF